MIDLDDLPKPLAGLVFLLLLVALIGFWLVLPVFLIRIGHPWIAVTIFGFGLCWLVGETVCD